MAIINVFVQSSTPSLPLDRCWSSNYPKLCPLHYCNKFWIIFSIVSLFFQHNLAVSSNNSKFFNNSTPEFIAIEDPGSNARCNLPSHSSHDTIHVDWARTNTRKAIVFAIQDTKLSQEKYRDIISVEMQLNDVGLSSNGLDNGLVMMRLSPTKSISQSKAFNNSFAFNELTQLFISDNAAHQPQQHRRPQQHVVLARDLSHAEVLAFEHADVVLDIQYTVGGASDDTVLQCSHEVRLRPVTSLLLQTKNVTSSAKHEQRVTQKNNAASARRFVSSPRATTATTAPINLTDSTGTAFVTTTVKPNVTNSSNLKADVNSGILKTKQNTNKTTNGGVDVKPRGIPLDGNNNVLAVNDANFAPFRSLQDPSRYQNNLHQQQEKYQPHVPPPPPIEDLSYVPFSGGGYGNVPHKQKIIHHPLIYQPKQPPPLPPPPPPSPPSYTEPEPPPPQPPLPIAYTRPPPTQPHVYTPPVIYTSAPPYPVVVHTTAAPPYYETQQHETEVVHENAAEPAPSYDGEKPKVRKHHHTSLEKQPPAYGHHDSRYGDSSGGAESPVCGQPLYTAVVDEGSPVSQQIMRAAAVDPNNLPLVWSVEDTTFSRFSIDRVTGDIVVTASLKRAAIFRSAIEFRVRATNEKGYYCESTVRINVIPRTESAAAYGPSTNKHLLYNKPPLPPPLAPLLPPPTAYLPPPSPPQPYIPTFSQPQYIFTGAYCSYGAIVGQIKLPATGTPNSPMSFTIMTNEFRIDHDGFIYNKHYPGFINGDSRTFSVVASSDPGGINAASTQVTIVMSGCPAAMKYGKRPHSPAPPPPKPKPHHKPKPANYVMAPTHPHPPPHEVPDNLLHKSSRNPMFSSLSYSFLVDCLEANYYVGVVAANDPHNNHLINYNLIGAVNEFKIDPNSGELRTLSSLRQNGDRIFTISASDQFGSTSSVPVRVTVNGCAHDGYGESVVEGHDHARKRYPSGSGRYLPRFSQPIYQFTVSCNAPVGYHVGQVSAVDKDGTSITYSLYLAPSVEFNVNAQTGIITTAIQNTQPSTSVIKILATDGHGQTATAIVQIVTVNCGDFPNEVYQPPPTIPLLIGNNDPLSAPPPPPPGVAAPPPPQNGPVFPLQAFYFSVACAAPAYTAVGSVKANYADHSHPVSYGTSDGRFSADADGQIHITFSPISANHSPYIFTVTARDVYGQQTTSTVTVTVVGCSANPNRYPPAAENGIGPPNAGLGGNRPPVFVPESFQFTLQCPNPVGEQHEPNALPPGALVGVLTATDYDNDHLIYSITDNSGIFIVNSLTGQITTTNLITANNIFTFVANVRDKRAGGGSSATVTVNVVGCSPQLPPPQPPLSPSDHQIHDHVIHAPPSFSQATYTIHPQCVFPPLPPPPPLLGSTGFDGVGGSSITAAEGGAAGQIPVDVQLGILNSNNDNSPTSSGFDGVGASSITAAEGGAAGIVPVGTQLGIMTATDPRGGPLTYRFSGDAQGDGSVAADSRITIQPETGAITALANLPFGTTIVTNVIALNAHGQQASVQVRIIVNCPQPVVVNVPQPPLPSGSVKGPHAYAQCQPPVNVDILENSPPGSFVAQLNGAVGFTLVSATDASFFVVGHNGRVTLARSPDREALDAFCVLVQGTLPGNGGFCRSEIYVGILDQNDNVPVFSHPAYDFVTTCNVYNAFVGRVMASDYDAGRNGIMKYEIVAGNNDASTTSNLFSIDSCSGELRANGNLIGNNYLRENGRTITVRASSPMDSTMQSTVAVTIRC